MNGKMDFFPRPNKKLISVEETLNVKGVIHRGSGYDKKTKKTNKPSYTLLKSTHVLFSKNGKDFLPFQIKDVKKIATFNKDFKFKGSYNQIYALIGNSVPPKFMEAIATKTMLNLKEMGINKEEYTGISLFAGCGGSSLGYKMAGFKELLAIDFDKNAVETFKLNFKDVPIWQKDITQIRGEEILHFCNIKEGELDVLDGSPPCQGFSTAGKRKGYDSRNDLVLEYIRLVDELQPKIFVMENVSGMVKGTMKGLFKEYMLKMKALNYIVKCKLINAKYYNVPQSRERLIWIGVRKDLEKEGVFSKGNKKLISPAKVIPELRGKKFITFRNTNRDSIRSATLPAPAVISGHQLENRIVVEDLQILKKLQSFSGDFKVFTKTPIINAVPPNFMYAIVKTIKEEILT
jgi:DNA-cytosine methyltransferase